MIEMMALLILAAQVDVPFEAHSRRAAGEFELTIAGRSRSALEGTIAELRFRRVVRRVDWSTQRLLTQPEDRPWGRHASLDRGSFRHRELFTSPREVEVELSLLAPGEEGSVPHRTAIVRIGTVPETMEALRSDVRRMDRAIAEARTILEGLGAGKDRALLGRAERARAAAKSDAESSQLSATADLVERFFADLAAAGGSDVRFLSAVTGAPFTADSARTVLGTIEAVGRRERRLILVDEAGRVAREVNRLAESGDARAWSRAEAPLEKALQAVEEARERSWEELTDFLADLEMSFHLASQRVQCPASVSAEWEKIQTALPRKAALLEESLREGSDHRP